MLGCVSIFDGDPGGAQGGDVALQRIDVEDRGERGGVPTAQLGDRSVDRRVGGVGNGLLVTIRELTPGLYEVDIASPDGQDGSYSTWTNILDKRQITVQGPFLDSGKA